MSNKCPMKMTATSLNFSWISMVEQWKRIAAASSLFFDKVVTACKAPRYPSTIKEQLGMLDEQGRILEQRSVPGTWVDD